MSAPEKYQYEIEEIRARLPMLDVVAKAGLEVRRMGRMSKVACPFHGERTASFVVYEDHGHCYGCGWHGSIFDFWMGVKGVDFKRAVEDLAGMAGVRAVTMAEAERWRASVVARPVERERERPELPELRKLSAGECRVLAEGRGVSAWAVQEAGERGLLWGAEFQGQAAWCLTDRARRNAQLRRLDGNRWYGNVKAWTVAGSWASWPVGCVQLGGARKIAVVEGGPDALAILDVIRGWGWGREDCGVVVMFGASASIAAWCLEKFQSARVRIFAHNDLPKGESGARAGFVGAERWAKQLGSVAREVDWVSAPDGLELPGGGRVCDVNDVVVWEGATGRVGEITGGWRF